MAYRTLRAALGAAAVTLVLILPSPAPQLIIPGSTIEIIVAVQSDVPFAPVIDVGIEVAGDDVGIVGNRIGGTVAP